MIRRGGDFFGALFSFLGGPFFSFGRGASELGTVTRIVVAVAKRRTVVAFGLLCCPRVSTVSTVTTIGGVLVATLRTVVAFSLACCPRLSEGLHIFCCNCFCFVFGFVSWSLFKVWALGL